MKLTHIELLTKEGQTLVEWELQEQTFDTTIIVARNQWLVAKITGTEAVTLLDDQAAWAVTHPIWH